MKRPGVANSKKGAIFNILWLLVENPRNLKYFRQADIKKQLIEEFGIDIDRKTIQDYLNILTELKLPYELHHEANKGYYICNNMISDTEREILISSLYEQKALNLESRINLFNFLTNDCSKNRKIELYNLDKNNFFSHNSNLNDHFSLVENLEIIQRAIEEKRMITFEYLNYNRYGELMTEGRIYTTVPLKTKFINGMFYLYNADNLWGNMYCGTKIKYMRNIKLGEVCEVVKVHEKYNFTFEVQVIYDWAIEFIADNFDDYQLIRNENSMKAIINTPYVLALDWCKRYAPFFIILDEGLRDAVLKDMKIVIDNFYNKDPLILKIKSAIVDFHYKNPVNENSKYDVYMKGLYKLIDFNLSNVGYVLDSNTGYYTNGIKNVCFDFLECSNANTNYVEGNLVSAIEKSYYKLKKKSDCKKIMVVFFDDVSEEEIAAIIKIVNCDPFIDVHDKFSTHNEAYFYKYLVFEVE